MKKLNGILFALALVTIATLASSNVHAQSAPDGHLVRVMYIDTWVGIPIDITVKNFTITEPFSILTEGPFVGRAEVLFTGDAASYFEPGVNKNVLSLWSDTVLMPGTRLHLEAKSRPVLPWCGDLSDPTTDACYLGSRFFQSVLVTNK